MKSHWKPVQAVLTASGFLHLYRDKSKQKVHSSHSLGDCAVESGDAAHPQLHTVKLTFAARGGLFSSPTVVFLKAANDDEQMEWVTQMQKFATHTAPTQASDAAAAANGSGSAPASPAAAAAAAAPAAVPATAEHQQPSVVATATDADT